jgi:hypothetical protein
MFMLSVWGVTSGSIFKTNLMLLHRFTTVKVFLPVCFLLLIIMSLGCADKIKTDLLGYRTLDEGLTNSNDVIGEQSKFLLKSLQNQLMDSATVQKAQIWLPRAQQIEKLSEDVFDYILGLKSQLKKEAGLKQTAEQESFRENDKNAVLRLFRKQARANELYKFLEDYRKNVLMTDPLIDSSFRDSLQVTDHYFESSGARAQDFEKLFFDDIPVVAALAVLSKFQNNIRIIENKAIGFCEAQANK